MVWCEYGRVVGVPEHEAKLDTAAPALGGLITIEAMFEVYGALVNVIAEREEQDAPGGKVTLAL
jgi:hypothetical protein